RRAHPDLPGRREVAVEVVVPRDDPARADARKPRGEVSLDRGPVVAGVQVHEVEAVARDLLGRLVPGHPPDRAAPAEAREAALRSLEELLVLVTAHVRDVHIVVVSLGPGIHRDQAVALPALQDRLGELAG